jgi:[acyl-carrier-protein] S-malonyltransferase
VLSSRGAAPFRDMARELADGLTQPVRWRETVLALAGMGVARFVECGPGKVLTGLVRHTLHGVEAAPLGELVATDA